MFTTGRGDIEHVQEKKQKVKLHASKIWEEEEEEEELLQPGEEDLLR